MAMTKAPGDPPGRPLRRLPLPASQPPYDDEIGATPQPYDRRRRRLPDGGGPTQGALALSIRSGAAWAPEPHPRLRLVGDAPSPALPDPRRWTARLTQAAIEGIYGQRPIQQLTRWTDDAVFKALARRAGQRSAVRPLVRAIRVCCVSETVAEAAAVVALGPRVRAVAVRLEAVDDRWLCTALDFIEDAGQPPNHSASNARA